MDHAVALVEAYLRVNGYLTVGEYPVLDAPRHGREQTVTDLDILAVRLAIGHDAGTWPALDPALGAHSGGADMIVGEVKEGAPRVNRALREPRVLQAALTRFGCCTAAEADDVAGRLLCHGGVLRAHWDQIGYSQLKDPTLGLLALLEKSARAGHHPKAPQ